MDLRNLGLWPEGENPFYTADQYARKLDKDEAKTEAWDAIKNSLLGSIVKSVAGAAALPGDVYAGRTDPMSIEGIERAADLAGLVTLGSFGASKPAGAIGMGGRDKADDAVKGIKAYHGSPHDFDKFDLSKIGTGEGAQAYGHGLYFADSEGVARSYRDALSPSTIDGKPARQLGTTTTLPDDQLLESILAMEKTPANARWRLDRLNRLDLMEKLDEMMAAGKVKPGGHMYEVNIKADPDAFLDWDKRLDQQGPEVLKRLGIDRDQMDNLWKQRTEAKDAIRERYNPNAVFKMSDDELLAELSTPPARDPLYDVLAKSDNALLGMTRDWVSRPDAPARELLKAGNPVKNAERLRGAGIPGVKYLDQGSRAAGEGSRNYVVFDDKLIEILRKYGLTALLGLGGAAGAYQSQAPDNGT